MRNKYAETITQRIHKKSEIMKRIGMVLDHSFPPDPRVENEAESLAKAGFEVFLWSYNFDQLAEEEKYKGFTVYRTSVSEYWVKKFQALVNTVPVYNWFLVRSIKKYIRKYKIDYLHVHDLYLLGAAIKLKHYFNIPIIADLHENYVDALKHYKFSTTFPGNVLISIPKWERTEKQWLEQVDKIIVVIEETVERLQGLDIPLDKIYVVPNYVNIKEFKNFPLDKKTIMRFKNEFVISYLGGFDYHRGLETLIRAFADCLNKGLDMKLVLVGSGRNLNELKGIVTELGIGEKVSFEGYQPFSTFPSYISASQICAIPHVKSVHTDHTIPHKLFHAMLLKKPVIVSNCRPLKRIVKECNCGLVFQSEDYSELAERIAWIYNQPKEAEEMGLRGEECVKQKYNWIESTRNLIKLYREI